jgi:TonB family protein
MLKQVTTAALLLLQLGAYAQQKQVLYFENGKKAVEGQWKIVYSRRENPRYLQYLMGAESGLTPGNTKLSEIHYEDADRGLLLQFEGLCTVYYNNGHKRVVAHYKHGIPEGIFEWYNSDGSVVASGAYTDGMPQGKWNYFYADGKKMLEANYSAFAQQDLDSMLLHPRRQDRRRKNHESINGAVAEIIDYLFRPYNAQLPANTRPDGKQLFYTAAGTKIAEMTYKKGIKSGQWVYYTDGQMHLKASYEQDTLTALLDSAGRNMLEHLSTDELEGLAAWAQGIKSKPKEALEAPAPRPEIFTMVEQMPEFPGDINKYLSTNLRYPAEAAQKDIQGRVVVRFIVQEDGSIDQATVVRGIGGGCDEEALRVVKAMPRWKPGKQNGKPVKVYFTLPISFKLL